MLLQRSRKRGKEMQSEGVLKREGERGKRRREEQRGREKKREGTRENARRSVMLVIKKAQRRTPRKKASASLKPQHAAHQLLFLCPLKVSTLTWHSFLGPRSPLSWLARNLLRQDPTPHHTSTSTIRGRALQSCPSHQSSSPSTESTTMTTHCSD